MKTAASVFNDRLTHYKEAIDADISIYTDHVRKSTSEQYGEYAQVVTNAYLDMLSHGGKRVRGALVMAGYEMCGGRDQQMIVRAATALEMIHTYILIIDDIQDRSSLRRGRPTVHEVLAEYHRQHGLKGDAQHVGMSLALNAALTGAHAAQTLLAGLSVDQELRIKAMGIINMTMITTAHGQTTDIMNEVSNFVSNADVEHALEWKTAHYTFLNPLCVGMVLAGAGCKDTDAIRDYALHTGKAFQITDDIIGVFGDDRQTGKSNKDDVREGKRTLLVEHGLKKASSHEKKLLASCLGNKNLTDGDFAEFQRILIDCGALDHAKKLAQGHIAKAAASLGQSPAHWQPEAVEFLKNLANSLLGRAV